MAEIKKSDSQSVFHDEEIEKTVTKKKSKSQTEKEKKAKIKHEKEQKALEEFKGKIKGMTLLPGHDNDECFLRFLRARKLDVPKATVLFEGCLKWRASYKPEAIVFERDCPRESQNGKGFLLGKDVQGRPAFLVFTGRHDPKNADNEECLRALIYYVEQAVKAMGPGVEQCTLLVDFENWGLKNADHDLDKMMIEAIQNYYPERLGVAYLMNAPTIFKMAWTVVKPLLDKRTASKLRFLSGSSSSREELLSVFGAATLPTRYGGQNAQNLEPTNKTIKGPPKGLKMDK